MRLGFIGRRIELEVLEREYSRGGSFVLITGRRRVGKTRLIGEFITGKDAVYYLATQQTERLALSDFSALLSRRTGRTYGAFRDWRDAFSAFAESGMRILVLDEFQYLCHDPAFASLLQESWDTVLSHAGVMLVVCGSHMTTMESLGDRDSPLYGRFTRRMVVQPLPFGDVRGTRDFRDAVESYSVLGGVPRYMELFDEAALRGNVLRNVMDPTSPMHRDPEVLLGGEVSNPVSYMSIMKAVAAGNRRVSDISSAVEVPSTTLNAYLQKLMDVRMLRRDVPVTDPDPARSKNGLYSIEDLYTSFWFRFVYPYASDLEMGHPEWAMSEFDSHFAEGHVSFVFERICRDSVWDLAGDIGFRPVRVGGYWDRSTEIDVMALDPEHRRAFAAECKYRSSRPVDRHVLNALRAKCASIRKLEGYDVTYGLFSVSGFDDGLMDEPGVLLVDRGEVVRRPTDP